MTPSVPPVPERASDEDFARYERIAPLIEGLETRFPRQSRYNTMLPGLYAISALLSILPIVITVVSLVALWIGFRKEPSVSKLTSIVGILPWVGLTAFLLVMPVRFFLGSLGPWLRRKIPSVRRVDAERAANAAGIGERPRPVRDRRQWKVADLDESHRRIRVGEK
ncbi:MAG: hypothetical protein SFU56_17205 [Capsulimonadales bacterium]|nr:hypothetical protein [Capsulimonadales bacterium]